MEEQKKLLLKIFEITETRVDKVEFAEMFLDLIKDETVYQLIQSLPKTRQASASKKWDDNLDNPAALNSILRHYFTKKEIEDMSEKLTIKALQDYVRSIEARLDNTQRQQLQALADEIELPI